MAIQHAVRPLAVLAPVRATAGVNLTFSSPAVHLSGQQETGRSRPQLHPDKGPKKVPAEMIVRQAVAGAATCYAGRGA